MTLKHVYGATVVVFAFGVVTVGPAYAQRRDGSLLPQENSGQVTAVGCLVRGTAVRGGKKDKYALARPRKGPVASVPEATCTADPGADALTVDNPEKGNITDAMLGRWVEISGRLERETSKDPDDLRELDVATFRLVPVVIPPRPVAAPPPTPAAGGGAHRNRPHAAPEPTPAPAAPAPEPRKLPKTASHASSDWIGRVALACSRPHASFVPSPATRLDAADTDNDRGHDSSRCRALRRSPLTGVFGSWRPHVGARRLVPRADRSRMLRARRRPAVGAQFCPAWPPTDGSLRSLSPSYSRAPASLNRSRTRVAWRRCQASTRPRFAPSRELCGVTLIRTTNGSRRRARRNSRSG